MKLFRSGPLPTVSTGLKWLSYIFHSSSRPAVPPLRLVFKAVSRASRYFSANLPAGDIVTTFSSLTDEFNGLLIVSPEHFPAVRGRPEPYRPGPSLAGAAGCPSRTSP